MNATSSQQLANSPTIRLTPAKAEDGTVAQPMALSAFELVAYWQDLEHTRLHLVGRRTLEVKETTQEIDRLLRAAAR